MHLSLVSSAKLNETSEVMDIGYQACCQYIVILMPSSIWFLDSLCASCNTYYWNDSLCFSTLIETPPPPPQKCFHEMDIVDGS